MRTLHKAGRAVLSGFGVALVGALVLANGHASGAASAADATRARDVAVSPPYSGFYECVLENGKLGSIVLYRDGVCEIIGGETPGSSKLFCEDGVCPTCKSLQKRWDCPLM